MTDFKFSTTHCHHCGEPLTTLTHCDCGMIIYSAMIHNELTFRSIGWKVGDMRVAWHSNNQCSILSYRGGKTLKLPWLPFDITEQQLKLIITFS